MGRTDTARSQRGGELASSGSPGGAKRAPKVLLGWKELKCLLDARGYEQGGFLLKHEDGAIVGVLPVPSRLNSPERYAMDPKEYRRLRRTRKDIAGVIHTHPSGDPEPSEDDRRLTKLFPVREGEYRAVWHPRSGRLTLFDQTGDVWVGYIRRPLWFRLIAPLFYE